MTYKIPICDVCGKEIESGEESFSTSNTHKGLCMKMSVYLVYKKGKPTLSEFATRHLKDIYNRFSK